MSFPFELNKFYSVPDDSVYHNLDALSYHQIKDLCLSSKHWDAAKRNRTVTDALRLGSAYHAMMLQPELFKERLKLKPKVDGRTKEGKAAKAEFEASVLPTDFVLDQEELDAGMAMRSVLESKKTFSKLMSNALHIEEFALTKIDLADLIPIDEPCEVLCRFKPDMITGEGLILDYKTMQSASLTSASYEIRSRKYHAQLAWYSYLYAVVTGEPPRAEALIIAQEKEDPYEASFICLDNGHLESGFEYLKKGLWNYYSYAKTGKLTGFSDDFELAILNLD